ncbi:hypothetical protein [Stigmatella aurantiaca]|uniref:Uncharacterized protein n=1 Tax=Stigmatella aurantiaca (strain DW4/3-1) TaxID=378806 RepID=Q08WE0_STIAD|nr:hypothetical protein [Stigmatella aurantiaca]ADO71744.1 uncharacterized protein STAUR_3956 [Stigmatella aurantiaca DW4/3-1]EAU64804.1 hypothetical protein STIAU_2597 [Stigmatella aurantiaca DW4/3-1]
MSNPKPPPKSRADKVYTALQGDDEFSTFSIDPDRKPKVVLDTNDSVRAVATPISRSIIRFFRKVFGE